MKDESKKVAFRFYLRPNEELVIEYAAFPNAGARFRAAATLTGDYRFEVARGDVLAIEMSAHTHDQEENNTQIKAQARTLEAAVRCSLMTIYQYRASSSCAKSMPTLACWALALGTQPRLRCR